MGYYFWCYLDGMKYIADTFFESVVYNKCQFQFFPLLLIFRVSKNDIGILCLSIVYLILGCKLLSNR